MYIDIVEEEEEAPSDEEDTFCIDDSAMTRVLRLSSISEAIAAGDETEDFGGYDEEEFEITDSADENEDFEDNGEEEPEDFENVRACFRDIDSLFTSEKGRDLSLTDEFDIVFASSDSKKNVEEIRRQPIVAANEPKKPKKHTKF